MGRELRLLVVGGSGELGQQVVLAANEWDVHATYFTRPGLASNAAWHQLDVADHQAVHRLVTQLHPDAVVHVAVSDRDRAKLTSDEDFYAVVVDGGRSVAEAAAGVGARCVALSTDLVFDGKRGNYSEKDPPNPIMPYGQAKVDMEGALLAMNTDVVVVRTSLILTLEPMGRHLTWIVDALRRGQQLDLFTDELRCPIWGDELAAALLELIDLNHRGLLHIAGPEATHRYELGMAVANHFSLDPSLLTSALSAESGLNRPLNCTLDSSLARAILKAPIHGVDARIGRSAKKAGSQ